MAAYLFPRALVKRSGYNVQKSMHPRISRFTSAPICLILNIIKNRTNDSVTNTPGTIRSSPSLHDGYLCFHASPSEYREPLKKDGNCVRQCERLPDKGGREDFQERWFI